MNSQRNILSHITFDYFTNWHTNEPSLYDPRDALSRDCIDMLRHGKWNDRTCSYGNQFICEK